MAAPLDEQEFAPMTCEFRSTDEPRPGVVFGGTFVFAEVRYSAIDGKAIVEGDKVRTVRRPSPTCRRG